jgi:hypothetical protein
MVDYKNLYQKAHEAWFKVKYPLAYADGHLTAAKLPNVNKSNGLTKFIVNYLNWLGHHAERTNNMGIPKKKTYQKFNIFSQQLVTIDNGVEWTKGNGTKGSSDIKGHFRNPKYTFSIPFYIEVKVGKDRLSDEQIEYGTKVSKTGALYAVVKNVEDFFDFYNKALNL